MCIRKKHRVFTRHAFVSRIFINPGVSRLARGEKERKGRRRDVLLLYHNTPGESRSALDHDNGRTRREQTPREQCTSRVGVIHSGTHSVAPRRKPTVFEYAAHRYFSNRRSILFARFSGQLHGVLVSPKITSATARRPE